MELSRIAFAGLLAGVGVGRLAELRISRRNQRELIARGAARIPEPRFPLMVAVHTGILAGAALEVFFCPRHLYPWLAAAMAVVFLAANGVRWWVIRTLGAHWNVQVMDSGRLGVVSSGPYRWVRHPNYSAVFAEMLALPLIHTAWVTALLGGLANLWVLRARIALEDRVLLADAGYRAAMGAKPRFLPYLF
jgi:methyltransferase